MSPSWIFAVLIVLSAFLGMGQAHSIRLCGDDKQSQCVAREFCMAERRVQLRMVECGDNEVCCNVDQINITYADEVDPFA